MRDLPGYKEVGKTTNTVTHIKETEPDILVVVPLPGTMDNGKDAQENVAFFYKFARTLGKPIGIVVILTNMISQEPEARQAYAEIEPDMVYAAGLVVENALSRALGSFFIGLTRPIVPTKLFNSVDDAIEWIRMMHPAEE